MPKKIFSSLLLGAALAGSAMSFGYFLYHPKAEEPVERITVSTETKPVTSENTIIEYIYSYGDGVTETSYSPIPPYLIGLDEEGIREEMAGFVISSFSPEKVRAEKLLDGESRQHYILGEKDGYLAVYYKKGRGLKEVTNTPVNTLSTPEYEMLGKTEIIGSDRLARLLEDMES